MRSLARFCAFFILCLIRLTAYAAPVQLENDAWRIRIAPETLAVQATPTHGQPIAVSKGGAAQVVQDLKQTANTARWRWLDAKNKPLADITVRLQGVDLFFEMSAAQSPTTLTVLNQPQDAIGRALILPFAEGCYVPAHDARWRDFLTEFYNDANTTADLSLPLWGMDYGAHTLTWIFENPYDNHLRMSAQGDDLNIALSHDFTALDGQVPMRWMLHLDTADPLAGTRRYRTWLMEQGRYSLLLNRQDNNPAIAKLYGAPQIYVWGPGLLCVPDVIDWPLFLARLKGTSSFAQSVRERFPGEDADWLNTLSDISNAAQRKRLIAAFDAATDSLARSRWQNAPTDTNALASSYGQVRDEVVATFGPALDDPARRGSTTRIVAALKQAGLTHAWIGLANSWEDGLWHPQAVAAAVDAGYLIAPYDSYETAVIDSGNTSWQTAGLGRKIYDDCAILDTRQQPLAGFQKQGHATDPSCVAPLLKAGIAAILAKVPFNSWFLDVYATGTLQNNYRTGATQSQRAMAQARKASLDWIGHRQLMVGSEDGNAVTAQGIDFAQGFQTTAWLGWDPDMTKNKSSRYFLGAWWPEDEPAKFFKPTPIKPEWAKLHFDPTTRLPLYQSVFHGSIISTHHWTMDSLKFPGVYVENTLTQLLYDVPPLYNLSLDTLDERLPAIVRANRFFGPLDRRLATTNLNAFVWLTQDRRVQETLFSDGTRLIANFSDREYRHGHNRVPPHALLALVPKHRPEVFRPHEDAPIKPSRTRR